MSEFATKLSENIAASKQTIYALSVSSGVDRSLIHRMMKGERTPSKKATVLALARSLLLTTAETAELVEAYEIARLGEDTYLELRYIRQMLAELGKILLKDKSTPPAGHLSIRCKPAGYFQQCAADHSRSLRGEKTADAASRDRATPLVRPAPAQRAAGVSLRL